MQSRESIKTNLVERLEWRFARPCESRVARRLWKKQGVAIAWKRERSW